MSSINDDNYWNSSFKSIFNFDDEDLSTSQIDAVANDVFSSKQEEINIFAIDFIISKKCLDLLLSDGEAQNVYVVPPVREVVKKMIHGQRFVLEIYKSYKDKLLLLDEALKTFNGDIILRVTDFLRRTLKFNIFCNVLLKRRVALVQYSNFLKTQGNLEELENLYMATGVTSNMDLFFWNSRMSVDKQETSNRLKCFLSGHPQYWNTSTEAKFLLEYDRFLEWQISRNMDGDSVVEQLAVICRKQWEHNAGDDEINEFKNLFKISDAQFEWTVINCLSFMGLWKKLIEMFIKPNWFKKKSMLKSAINCETFIWGVSRHNPPKNVLEQLLICVNDTDKSLALAEKLQCHKFLIEHYSNQRDRIGLLSCKSKVELHSEEFYMIKKALEAPDKKWKN